MSYIEVPLTADVFLGDSLLTNNSRFLMGSYTDPQLGKMEAVTYTQFYTTNPATLPTGATLDRVVLNLAFDYYFMGNNAAELMEFSAFELVDTLRQIPYWNFSTRAFLPDTVAKGTYFIEPARFSNPSSRDIDTVELQMSPEFSNRLFATMLEGGETFQRFVNFTGKFKGLAIKGSGADKLVGINPQYSADTTNRNKTRLRVYYSFPETVEGVVTTRRRVTDFTLFNAGGGFVTNFISVSADRAGSVVQGQPPFAAFVPPDQQCYVQGGVPVYTRIDFSKFYTFLDTIPNITFNSVELVIDPVAPQPLPLPNALELRVMDDTKNNRTDFFDVTRRTALPSVYTGRFSSKPFNLADSLLIPVGDTGTNISLARNSDNTRYSGFITSLAQTLATAVKQGQAFRYFGLALQNPIESSSASRVGFSGQNIKLRIFYTKPTINRNP
ncbi:MAG: DUF4270 domain-containing protein [Cyclobacteriaceae bacterium]|nr:DUF4270 domain-containing protein [Cyclobacteriaceae bacterium]